VQRVAIVGGGASGLLCAILCAKEGLRVDLFEQNEKCAKKILVSGNGRCNISNTKLSKEHFFSNHPDFAWELVKRFDFDAFEKLCNSFALVLETKEDGRVYPQSNEAKSVASLFLRQAEILGVTLFTKHKIDTLTELFESYDAVVVATGSEAAPHLGGNRSGYDFAQEFGHTIVPTYPSLVQLHLNSTHLSKISGAKLDAAVTLFCNKQKRETKQGDILFTKYGISGFAVLDISQTASLALQNYESVSLSLNLLPQYNPQKLSKHFQNISKLNPHYSVFDMLCGLLPQKFAQTICDSLEFSNSMLLLDLSTKESKKLAHTLLDWRFEVIDTHGFRHAEVSGGGVDTFEVDAISCESLQKENLYFCGEVLDVVGARGGYNFAFAWASAAAVARSIISKKS